MQDFEQEGVSVATEGQELELSSASSLPVEAEYSSIVTYPEATSTVNDELRVHESNSMTVKTSCLAINKFFHKHHLSKKAQEDLLILMQQLLPQPNNLPVTLYYFQKQTDFDTDTFHLQYYCPRCYSLGDKDTLCSNQSCKGAIGDCHFISAVAHVMSLPITVTNY